MTVIIDRFEGNFAIIEIDKGRFSRLPAELIPGAREGDVVSISIDRDETAKRKESVGKLMDSLFED